MSGNSLADAHKSGHKTFNIVSIGKCMLNIFDTRCIFQEYSQDISAIASHAPQDSDIGMKLLIYGQQYVTPVNFNEFHIRILQHRIPGTGAFMFFNDVVPLNRSQSINCGGRQIRETHSVRPRRRLFYPLAVSFPSPPCTGIQADIKSNATGRVGTCSIIQTRCAVKVPKAPVEKFPANTCLLS